MRTTSFTNFGASEEGTSVENAYARRKSLMHRRLPSMPLSGVPARLGDALRPTVVVVRFMGGRVDPDHGEGRWVAVPTGAMPGYSAYSTYTSGASITTPSRLRATRNLSRAQPKGAFRPHVSWSCSRMAPVHIRQSIDHR